eukprot:12655667-Alexandrium_andersonii.AAC.1
MVCPLVATVPPGMLAISLCTLAGVAAQPRCRIGVAGWCSTTCAAAGIAAARRLQPSLAATAVVAQPLPSALLCIA